MEEEPDFDQADYNPEFDPEEYNPYEEKQEYVAERDAYERVGHSGRLNMTLVEGGSLGDLYKKIIKESISPEERFYIYVDAISRKLNADGLNLSQSDIDTLLERASGIPNVKFINPTAYILGYLASRNAKNGELDKKKVKNIINYLDITLVQENNILPPDVVRYARFWMLVLEV